MRVKRVVGEQEVEKELSVQVVVWGWLILVVGEDFPLERSSGRAAVNPVEHASRAER